jgi:hypothetical protein
MRLFDKEKRSLGLISLSLVTQLGFYRPSLSSLLYQDCQLLPQLPGKMAVMDEYNCPEKTGEKKVPFYTDHPILIRAFWTSCMFLASFPTVVTLNHLHSFKNLGRNPYFSALCCPYLLIHSSIQQILLSTCFMTGITLLGLTIEMGKTEMK